MTGPAVDFLSLVRAVAPLETTKLSPEQEAQFRQWAQARWLRDVDNPDAHYDYRGFWLNGGQSPSANGHYPDTYKQHGHPTFSQESLYSGGAHDGGTWQGETFSPPTSADTVAMIARMRQMVLRRKATP